MRTYAGFLLGVVSEGMARPVAASQETFLGSLD